MAPGFNPKVVDFCIGQGVPVIPGVCTPSEIEQALERGLEVLKFFPAGASGGLDYLKAVCGPYGGVLFVPTGGVEPGNMKDYLAFKNVFAVGGTWIAKDTMISAPGSSTRSRGSRARPSSWRSASSSRTSA